MEKFLEEAKEKFVEKLQEFYIDLCIEEFHKVSDRDFCDGIYKEDGTLTEGFAQHLDATLAVALSGGVFSSVVLRGGVFSKKWFKSLEDYLTKSAKEVASIVAEEMEEEIE